MNRYERRMQFERWYAMREAYRTGDPDDRRSVISIEDAIRLADALPADAATRDVRTTAPQAEGGTAEHGRPG